MANTRISQMTPLGSAAPTGTLLEASIPTATPGVYQTRSITTDSLGGGGGSIGYASVAAMVAADVASITTGSYIVTQAYYDDADLTTDMPSGVGGAVYRVYPIATAVRTFADHVLSDDRVAVLQTNGSGEVDLYQVGGKRDTSKTYDNQPHILTGWTVADCVKIPAGYFPIASTVRFPSNSKRLSGYNWGRFTSDMSTILPTSTWTCQVAVVPAFSGASFTPAFTPTDVIINGRQLSREADGLEEWNMGSTNVLLRTSVTTSDVVEVVANNVLIDVNENNSNSSALTEGGQFNCVENLLIRGDADWNNPADNRRYLTGIKGWHVREGTRIEKVAFRRLGIPFSLQGYITYVEDCDVNECYIGPMMDNTFSGSLVDFNLLDCHRNWGRMRRCTAHNSCWQQSPSVGSLADDKGVTCHLNVVFTGYYYTEGGNRQIWCEVDPISSKHEDVVVENGLLGFAQLAGGGGGSSNVRVTTGSKFKFNGKNGSISGKSFVCDGNPELADTVWFTFVNANEVADNSKVFAPGKTNPATPNLWLTTAIGEQKRIRFENEINYERLELTSTSQTATLFNITEHAARIGGRLEIKCEGPNSYDVYSVYFGYSTEGDKQIAVTTHVRNTGGTGTNNCTVDVSDGSNIKIKTNKAGTFRISYQCCAHGFIQMKAPTIA